MPRAPQREATGAVVFRLACLRAGRGGARRLPGGRGGECRACPPGAGSGRSRLLGPAPAAGAARSLPHQTIRFLTEADYPPFDYSGPDGNPAGFNVDLARLICDEIKVSCTIQARRFDSLFDALNDNRGDAVIASIAPTAETRQRVDFTDPYYRTPARFVARPTARSTTCCRTAGGKKIAVIAGTAHEAYLKAMFTEAELQAYPDAETARAALRNKRGRSVVRRRHRSGVLAQRHRLRRLLRLPRRPVHREPLLRRGHRHRGETRQRLAAASVQLGAVPAVGEGQLHRSVAALFPDQPVLTWRSACILAGGIAALCWGGLALQFGLILQGPNNLAVICAAQIS